MTRKRHAGIELMRLAMMLGIVAQHVVGQCAYVRTILLYAFVSPVFVAMLRPHRFGGIFLVALAAAWLGGIPTGVAFQPLNWGYLLFFGTGVYMGLQDLWTVHERSTRIVLMVLFFIAAGGVVVSLVRVLPPMAYETVGYVVKIAVGIGGSLAVGMALHRLTPRLLSVLCGGRTA